MRTSRVSKETSRHFKREADAPVAPRRSTRSTLARFAYNGNTNGNATAAAVKPEAKQEVNEDDEDSSELSDLEFGSDIEDAIKKTVSPSPSPAYLPDGDDEGAATAPATRKRKRAATRTTTTAKAGTSRSSRVKAEKKSESDSEIDFTTVPQSSSASTTTTARRVRKPARTITSSSGGVTVQPPSDWEEMYALVKEMRVSGPAKNAAVDTMGCERLASDDASPKDRRFHTLVALMLSSQTKDTVNAEAMARLKREMPACAPGRPKGLNLDNMLAVEPTHLNEMIGKVGFHNNKTKFLKQTAILLRDKFGSDIPPTIEGLTSLPGVGPKMAYLVMSAEAGWNRVEGIGVDVHVHRITNLWGWQAPPSRSPEETRLALQSWLPHDRWKEINWLLVGFGQSVCLPIGRKCGQCELGLRGLCKSAEKKKVVEGRRRRELVQVEKVEKGEEGEEEKVIKMEVEREVDEVVVKEEVVNEPVPAGVVADDRAALEGGVKREEADTAPAMKVEDVGNGAVLRSIETDGVKDEVKRDESEAVKKEETAEVGAELQPPVKREEASQARRSYRTVSTVIKTEAREEDEEMVDAEEAPVKLEPVKQESVDQQRQSRPNNTSGIVKVEVKMEDEAMLYEQPIKNEGAAEVEEAVVPEQHPKKEEEEEKEDVHMEDNPAVKDEDDFKDERKP